MEEKPETSVKLEKVDGEWTVFVVEGSEIIQQTFETKQFAQNLAAGQRQLFLGDDRLDDASCGVAISTLVPGLGDHGGMRRAKS